MRVVFVLRCPVPELVDALSRAGCHVTIELTQDEHPVAVTAYLGPDALDLLVKHAASLSLPYDEPEPSARALRALLRILGLEPPERHLKLAE